MKKQTVANKKMLTVVIVFLSYFMVIDVQAQEGSFWSGLKDRWQNWKTEKFSNVGQGYRDWQAGSWGTSVPREATSSMWSRFKESVNNWGQRAELGQQARIARTTEVGRAMFDPVYRNVIFPAKVATYYPVRWIVSGKGGFDNFDKQFAREKFYTSKPTSYTGGIVNTSPVGGYEYQVDLGGKGKTVYSEPGYPTNRNK